MTPNRRCSAAEIVVILILMQMGASAGVSAQEPPVDRTQDRGDGVPLSMFGTYIAERELIVYPFFEYYRDNDYEYEAGELGFEGTTELRSRYRAREGLLFVGYGVSDRLALEFEIAGISATLDKAPNDVSALPPQLSQSGLGDVESQIRWRWRPETASKPEIFSYFETVFPVQRSNLLIGTPTWEFKLGTGVIRAFRWGTMTARAAIAHADGGFEPGEYALECLRRVSSRVQLFAAVEGSEDEVELITEGQVVLTRHIVLKLNNAFGLTSKATDWAPEVGVMFRFQ
jgi:hypothetical protein